jgi:2-iminobutanoate/2-iminopropanoate deaminase
MTKSMLLICLLLGVFAAPAVTERKVIVPANAPKPVGPYSPGIAVGDYLYVSGQGVRDAQNNVPAGVAAQARQCLENVKAIVVAAGLTMEHVVHTQLYLERLSDLPEVERVYAEYFPRQPPARVVLGVAKMPTDTPIELTAVAVRDLKLKKPLATQSLKPLGHASAAVQVGKRVYLSAVYGSDAADAQRQLQRALRESRSQVLWRNDYGATATAALPMKELPGQAGAAVSAVALQGAPKRLGECAADGTTIYCQAQSDTRAPFVGGQVIGALTKLQAALAKHGANFAQVTATNVYLDDIGEFGAMNEAYAPFFAAAPPTRTTVQPFAKQERGKGEQVLARIALVAVKE